jgi:TolB-like protein
MNFPTLYVANLPFSDNLIIDQLDRIFIHPDFSKSEILKKFLSYIVHETLTGNSGFLKEYTIALYVLDKPVNFNPQKDCIVRIHAVRLRQALANYYLDMGANDKIIIEIPKGKYVPIFIDRQQWISEKKLSLAHEEIKRRPIESDPATIAILPFSNTTEGKLVRAFNDSMCLQLCSSISQMNHLSVIAYQAVSSLTTKYIDLNEMGATVGFNYVITGGTQYVNRILRVNIQIIDIRTSKQIWSRIFERKPTATRLFDIQDEICQQTIIEAKNLSAIK